MSACIAKHAKYDVPDEQWKCPRCGVGVEAEDSRNGITIDEPAEGADDDCCRLHDDDELRCYVCDYTTTGKRFSARVAKANSLVPCPHCKGKGLVKP